MKTRAILLVAAAVMLAVPSANAQYDGNHRNDYQQTEKDKKVHKARATRSHRENVRQIRMDNRQDRNEAVATHRMERKITRENIREFRANATAQRRYHYSTQWRAPRNWHYQRWSYGQRLPMISYSRDYWISDYDGFGLYAPPYGYQWVRYGSNALLVDMSTGEIIRIEYNNFY